jgi:hypothetical protein
MAQWVQQLHPLRLQYEVLSNANPLMAPVAAWAEQVRQHRKPVAADNPFVLLQEHVSRQIVAALDAWRDMIERSAERAFLEVYGSPTLQAAVGIDPAGTHAFRKPAKSLLHRELLQTRIAELKARIGVGGLPEAVIRALIYVGIARAAVDERGFEVVRRFRGIRSDVTLATFKARVREQFDMLLLDEEAALAAIPAMLPPDSQMRREAFDVIKQVMGALGEFSAEDKKRLETVARLFGAETTSAAPSTVVPMPVHAKASRERIRADATDSS